MEYFVQYANSCATTTELTNFGLLPEYTWSSLLDTLEQDTERGVHYKLLFLQRHGEAWHNVIKERVGDDRWKTVGVEDSYDGITLFDDSLTKDGLSQVRDLSTKWVEEIEKGAPLPRSHYISPLQRTLRTHELTWGPSQPGLIVESLRERYGVYTCYERHNKSWIRDNYPNLEFEDGFREFDDLWESDRREPKWHVDSRVEHFLNGLFNNDESTVISVTSHAKFIKRLLKYLKHPSYELQPGQMLPIVIKAQQHGGNNNNNNSIR